MNKNVYGNRSASKAAKYRMLCFYSSFFSGWGGKFYSLIWVRICLLRELPTYISWWFLFTYIPQTVPGLLPLVCLCLFVHLKVKNTRYLVHVTTSYKASNNHIINKWFQNCWSSASKTRHFKHRQPRPENLYPPIICQKKSDCDSFFTQPSNASTFTDLHWHTCAHTHCCIWNCWKC